MKLVTYYTGNERTLEKLGFSRNYTGDCYFIKGENGAMLIIDSENNMVINNGTSTYLDGIIAGYTITKEEE